MANIEGGIKLALDVGYAPSRDPGVYSTAPAGFLGQVTPWLTDSDPLVAAYTLTDADSYREVDGTAAAFTITVPTYASYMLGKSIWHLFRIDADAHVVTVQRNDAGDTVNGGASTTLNGQWKMLTVWCVAANTFRAMISG